MLQPTIRGIFDKEPQFAEPIDELLVNLAGAEYGWNFMFLILQKRTVA